MRLFDVVFELVTSRLFDIVFELVNSLVRILTGGERGSATNRRIGSSVDSERSGSDRSEDSESESRSDEAGESSGGQPNRAMQRLADEFDGEFLSKKESPPETGPEVRGTIEDRTVRVIETEWSGLKVQMPTREFQGAVFFDRDMEAPVPSEDGGGREEAGARKPDWASHDSDDNYVTPDVEAYTSQAKTLFENMPDELRERFLNMMRRNGVTNFIVTPERAELSAVDLPLEFDGAAPVEVADELADVTHQLTSLAEAGKAGSFAPEDKLMVEGMDQSEVFHEVTCEYCQTQFQAVNRHKCPNCGAAVRAD